VDDVTYQSFGQTTEDDLLGLIAEQFVRVYHPIRCPSSYVVDVNSVVTCQNQRGANLSDTRFNTGTGGLFRDPRIHAAILALNNSFGVQQYNNGNALGTLTVYGAIAQKWRGTVALIGVTGYLKDYQYDARLEYEGPPSFVDPVGKPWKVKAFAEVANPPACTTTRISLCVPP
jgi:hypothetical protein